MGDWGVHAFKNDGALDFLSEFKATPTEDTLLAAFQPSHSEKYVGMLNWLLRRKTTIQNPPQDDCIIAAAEIIATLRGYPSATNPSDIAQLSSLHISDATVLVASEAVDALLRDSYLKDAWEETSDYEPWRQSVEIPHGNLKKCLQA